MQDLKDFFQGEISKPSRIALLVISLALIPALFLPVWEITLHAPQYPEGLSMEIMSHTVRGDIQEINNLTLQNATYRLVHYLLQQLPTGAVQAPSIHLDTPKGVIASRLSIQPETLSRILSRLSSDGLLSVSGSTITLHDLTGLRKRLEV